MNPQLWSYGLARGLHRHIFRQDTVLYKTDHTVLRILVKFSWHIPDFPIYSDGTKPGTLQTTRDSIIPDNDVILLNRSMNVAGGGESINVYGSISRELLKLAEKAASALPFQPIVGVDILTPGLSSRDGVVLELNVQPHFDLHHYITYGEPVNVAALEIKSLTAESTIGSLPRAETGHQSSPLTISLDGPIEIRVSHSE